MLPITSLFLLCLVILSQQQGQKAHQPEVLVDVQPGEDDSTMIIFYKVPPFTDSTVGMVFTYTVSLFEDSSASKTGPRPMFNITRDNATEEVKNYTVSNASLLPGRIYVVCVRVDNILDGGLIIEYGKDGTECAANRTRSNGTVVIPPKTVIGSLTSSSDHSMKVVVHTSVEFPYYVRYMQAELGKNEVTSVTFDSNSTHRQTTFTFRNVSDFQTSSYEICAWTDFSGYFISYTPWVFDQCATLTPSPESGSAQSDFFILSVVLPCITTFLI